MGHSEAQLATECLIQCTGKYSKCVETLCFECSKELDMTEVFLPSLLSTLALIAKLSPNIFIQRASHIMEFILETLLPFDPNSEENDGIYKENKIKSNKKKKKKKMEKMNPSLLISKQCGIQILVNYLLSILDLPSDRLGISSVGISPINSNKTMTKRMDLEQIIDDESDREEDKTLSSA